MPHSSHLLYMPGMQPQYRRSEAFPAGIAAVLPAIEHTKTEKQLLLSSSLGHEEKVCETISKYGEDIHRQIIYDIFISAAAHDEAIVINHIVTHNYTRSCIPAYNLLKALRMAVTQRFYNSINSLTQDPRWPYIVNYTDSHCPHILALALEDPHYDFIAKLIQLPHIDIPEAMVEAAAARRRRKIAELLETKRQQNIKTQDTLQKEKKSQSHDTELTALADELDLTDELPDVAPLGSSAQVIIERRKRQHRLEKLTVISA